MTHYVYILVGVLPSNGKEYFYTGYTNNLRRRYFEHKRMRSKYTKRFQGNVRIVYAEKIEERSTKKERKLARRRENQIKKRWSRATKQRKAKLNREQTNRIIAQCFH